MRHMFLFMMLLMLSVISVSANTRIVTEFIKCTDGDTAHFLVDGRDTTVRFLAIDTPEYTKEKEAYGKEASEFTCNALNDAEKIELEYDDGSQKTDKYGRELAWVFVDGTLLQKELVQAGLAQVTYIYGDYQYTDELYQVQEQAKKEQLNIWSNGTGTKNPHVSYLGVLLGIVIIVIILGSRGKGNKQKIRQLKRIVKKLNQR